MTALTTIIVPVDGSELSNRAIPLAAAIATAAGASITVTSVARYAGSVAGTTKRVGEARRLVPPDISVEEEVIVSSSPVVALLERTGASATVLCLATHDRRPASAALLDSVGSQIIEYARVPLIVVGPAGDASGLDGDVVVAIDGVHDATDLLSTATTWAAILGAPLRIVTVYEPVLPDLRRPEHFTRRHGPPTDPDAYLDDLALGLQSGAKNRIDAIALPDPISVADGLVQHLRDQPALMLVAGAPDGNHRLRPGVLRELVHRVPVPILVVPKTDVQPDQARVDAAERSGR